MGWVISVPVWGKRYRQTFVDIALPALAEALVNLRGGVRFLIHTDDPQELGAAMDKHALPVKFEQVSGNPLYQALQEGHQQAVREAEVGERVALLNADLVVSRHLFDECERWIRSGKKAVVLLGIRTDPGVDAVPIGENSRDLLRWAWAHRHQIIKDLEWGRGTSMLPTNLFFSSGDSVVARGFHLHPVAIHKTEPIEFRSTIDGDLLDRFPYDDVHVVTDPDDMSMLEISPPERRFPVRGRMLKIGNVAAAMRTRASAMHRWLFTHRIVVQGSLDEVTIDIPVAKSVLSAMGENTTFHRRR